MADLEEKLREWLDSQGYPLEMRVARSFLQRGFRVSQAQYYKDPESTLMRETDVRASIQREIHSLLVRVGFALECKLSKDKPWVLFTAPAGLAPPARVVQRPASKLGGQLLEALAQDPRVQELPLFAVHKRSAYGMTQAFTTGHDLPYAAASSVAKAAAAEASRFDAFPEVRARLCEIVLPVIVIDGLLYETFLNDDGEMCLERVFSGTLAWRNPIAGHPHTIIGVIAKDDLERFAEEASKSIHAFLKLSSEPASRLTVP